jgi:transposase
VKQESIMKEEQRQAAKKRMMVLIQEGYSWQEAARLSGIQTSRSTAYRWFQQFRTQGEAALHDGRHGHTAKMHKPIREWLEARCREELSQPSSSLQKELNAHFGVLVSITHLNRIRAAHGLERQLARMEKKSGPKLST